MAGCGWNELMNRPLLPTEFPPVTPGPLPCDEALAGPDPVEGVAELIDRSIGALRAQWTLGIAPDALGGAFADWWLHLASAPGRQLLLTVKAARKWQRLLDYSVRAVTNGGEAQRCIQPLPQDQRFTAGEWDMWPFGFYQQAFLLGQQWLDAVVRENNGVTPHHDAVVRFVMRQLLDMFSPSNFIATNPVVQKRFLETGGMSLVRGLQLLAEDWQRLVRRQPPIGTEDFIVGRDLATTPGKVVFRNTLIELLQYTPTTTSVRPEPILVVPAWIMKYYILDLSPDNSLIRSLVAAGFTVFAISWRNPGADLRETGMEDYQRDGIMAALAAVTAITGASKVHGCGYCLGGTLLAIAAATMARDGDKRLATLTFLAAQADFAEPGEIGLFIDDAQVRFLENLMWQQGFLDSRQMGGAFEMLRSADLVWSRGVQTYLLGERAPMTDLMAWNADGTRMPYVMHSQYLRRLFLQNDLAEGRYRVDDRRVAMADIAVPSYILGTERDHVAPWRSVWKLLDLLESEARFVLASGGHNGGIVAPSGQAGLHFRSLDRAIGAGPADPDPWFETTAPRGGSWWPDWFDWLAHHSGSPGAPPPLGRAGSGYPVLGSAPGRYVHQH
jgi:polyhydroxyalkanoate synthase subunit PhaC